MHYLIRTCPAVLILSILRALGKMPNVITAEIHLLWPLAFTYFEEVNWKFLTKKQNLLSTCYARQWALFDFCINRYGTVRRLVVFTDFIFFNLQIAKFSANYRTYQPNFEIKCLGTLEKKKKKREKKKNLLALRANSLYQDNPYITKSLPKSSVGRGGWDMLQEFFLWPLNKWNEWALGHP